MPAALRHLTIKPTHRCMHRCPYCDSRRQLLRMSHDVVLGVDDWRQVFAQADELGTEYLDISGGEPVLDAALPALVWEGKRRGWFVSLNSTGWGLPGTIDELVRVCLDQVVLSLMSLDPARHDAARGTPGSWTHFRRAVECLRGRPVRLVLHFILARQNHGELPELIDFAFANGASAVALAYPECDSANRRLLMSADDVRRFRREILPEALRRYAAHRPRSDASHANLAGLFAAHGDGGDFASGAYWPDDLAVRSVCRRPETFALIYPNGNVLPCNGVEYTHAPLVGNVLREELRTIWEGAAWAAFRRDRMDYCRFCPTNRHTGLAVGRTDNPPYAAPVVRRVPSRLPSLRPQVPDRRILARGTP